ncbi:hypothetical protein CC86DRAFT_421735 [Ophiobolus disseminans]|uniref:Ecp2 effector protein domain-containing protein n=1 Tax=Ophiobolus disseminans TaxID=1469910 RepID=A0A6A6ZTQ3_9PLEO|nr:hypothetical protein CC86DRAFT_421735 [Ophiobolus disseminans]
MWTNILVPLSILSATTTAFNFSAYTSKDCEKKAFSVMKPDVKLEDGCQPFAPFPDIQSMQLQWKGDKDNKQMLATFKTGDCCWADLLHTYGWEDECIDFNGNELYSFRIFDPEDLDKGKDGEEDRYKCTKCRGDTSIRKTSRYLLHRATRVWQKMLPATITSDAISCSADLKAKTSLLVACGNARRTVPAWSLGAGRARFGCGASVVPSETVHAQRGVWPGERGNEAYWGVVVEAAAAVAAAVASSYCSPLLLLESPRKRCQASIDWTLKCHKTSAGAAYLPTPTWVEREFCSSNQLSKSSSTSALSISPTSSSYPRPYTSPTLTRPIPTAAGRQSTETASCNSAPRARVTLITHDYENKPVTNAGVWILERVVKSLRRDCGSIDIPNSG